MLCFSHKCSTRHIISIAPSIKSNVYIFVNNDHTKVGITCFLPLLLSKVQLWRQVSILLFLIFLNTPAWKYICQDKNLFICGLMYIGSDPFSWICRNYKIYNLLHMNDCDHFPFSCDIKFLSQENLIFLSSFLTLCLCLFY